MLRKRIIPPFFIICIVLLIICIEIVEANTYKSDEISIPVFASDNIILENKQLNNTEKVIVSLLAGKLKETDKEKNTDYKLYVEQLNNFLSRSNVNLSEDTGETAAKKILEMSAIMDLEKVNDFNEMTLDGRVLVTNLSKEIYDLCGLKLNYNLQGEITRVSDKAGKIIYQNETQIKQSGFQFTKLMIILIVMAILILNCVVIAKKHKLYTKEVVFNGFEEKRFAQ